MVNIKFSIIIPVYNVEKYLKQCIDSVLNQTYKNYEIILIDDGSTDNSPAICDKYKDNDDRITVLHKKNRGAAAARNSGIRVIKGEYVLFLDSDDFWADNKALEQIVNILEKEKSDVVCFGYREFYEDTCEYKDVISIPNKSIDNLSLEDKIKVLIRKGIYTSSSWCKAIKSDLIKDNEIYFTENITSEDIDWSARILLNAKSYSLLKNFFYAYRQRKTSITHTVKYENVKTLSQNIIRCIEMVDKKENGRLKDLYLNYVAYQYITFLYASLLCDQDDEIRNLVDEMKKYLFLLKYNLNKKVKVVYLFSRLLGYDLMYKLLKVYIYGGNER